MINVLAIGLDYLMLRGDKVRGDVRERQFDYANQLGSLTLVVYSPSYLNIGFQKWKDNLLVYPTNSKNKAVFIYDAMKIASMVCTKKQIDVITTEDPFTTGFIGYLLKKRFGLPLNVQVHSNFCNNKYWINNRKINILFQLLGKFILKKADSIRVGTTSDKKSITDIGIAENKISVIPVHMDLEKFSQGQGEEIRSQLIGQKFKKIIMFVGRLSREKDIPTLLRSFQIINKKNNDSLLVIIGKGQEQANLETIADRLGISENVRFLGSIDHNVLPNYLAACDVFVISSLFEGTCVAMAEALAAGKPVVSTNVAGVNDLIIKGKTGFIVDQKDIQAMAEKIIYVLDNPDDFTDLKSENREHLKNIFNRESNINRLIKLWKLTAEKNQK